MKKFSKRLIALLCAVWMCITLLPMEAAAVEEPFYCEYTYVNPLYPQLSEDDIFFYHSSNFAPFSSDESVQDAEPIQYSTEREVAAYVREQLKARNTKFTVEYTGAPQNINSNDALKQYLDTFVNDINPLVFQHDRSDPTAGDYIRYQFNGIYYSASYNRGVLTLTFNCAYYDTADQQETLNQAVAHIIETLHLDGMTDYGKAKAIYNWLCTNVRYDYTNLEDDDYLLKYTAYAAIVNKTAVCQGYANAFYRLALTAGLDARILSGTGITNAESGNHAWNIVKLGSSWYYLDATWDEGESSTPSSWRYFLKNSSFENSHLLNTDGTEIVKPDGISIIAANDYTNGCGDLNGGGIAIQDVQLLYDYLVTGTTPTGGSILADGDFQLAADINNDTYIDVYDLQMLYEIVRGLRT